jgi:hypothetical protein
MITSQTWYVDTASVYDVVVTGTSDAVTGPNAQANLRRFGGWSGTSPSGIWTAGGSETVVWDGNLKQWQNFIGGGYARSATAEFLYPAFADVGATSFVPWSAPNLLDPTPTVWYGNNSTPGAMMSFKVIAVDFRAGAATWSWVSRYWNVLQAPSGLKVV